MPDDDDDDDDDDKSDDRGCLFLLGLAIVGLALGTIFAPAWGWLAIGAILIVLAIIG